MFFRWIPRSRSKPPFAHWSWNAWKRRERVPPLRRDLREREVRAAELRAERVHADEYLGDLVVRHVPLEDVHAIGVLADAAEPCKTLAVFLVPGVVDLLDAGARQERRVLVGLEHLGNFHPMRQAGQLLGGDDEGHLLEAPLQLVLGGIRLVVLEQILVLVVAVVLVHLGDHLEVVRVLQVEEQVDRLPSAPHAHVLAPDHRG